MSNQMTRKRVMKFVAVTRAKGERPIMAYTDLSGLDLSGLDLSEIDFTGSVLVDADLRRTNFRGADMHRTNMRGADMRGADFRDANLSGAALRYTKPTGPDMRHTKLTGANFRGANLADATLPYADLRATNLPGLFLDGLPSGALVFIPTPEGWHLTIGCWSGTTTELREMIAGDDWPEAEGEEIAVRRPALMAAADMCDAHAAANQHDLADAMAAADRWR